MVLLEVEDINTRYDESHIIYDLSLSVQAEEVVAILGRNGAGKTTTLRSIMGIQPPFSGSVTYRQEEITNKQMYARARSGIGYVPEERRIFPNLTVRENLLVGMHDGVDDADFQRVYGLFPELEELKDRKGEKLSGGEQQMVAIGRALTGTSELLLLDEPSEGLAPQLVERIENRLLDLKDDMTMLLVEQNYPTARAIADRYYIIDNGEIVAKGGMAELDANEALKDKYLNV